VIKRIAGLSLLALIAFGSAPASAAESVEVKRAGDRIDVLIGGHLFTTYYFGAATAKPYLFPLRSVQGTVVTRAVSEVHRALMRLIVVFARYVACHGKAGEGPGFTSRPHGEF